MINATSGHSRFVNVCLALLLDNYVIESIDPA